MDHNFTTFKEGAWEGLVLKTHQEAIQEALVHPASCTARVSDGRGHLLSFSAGELHGVVRPYRRGGLVRLVSKDRYYRDNRPLAEFEVHCKAQEMGLAVPQVLGVAWKQDGAWFEGCIATEDLQCPNLHQWLPGQDDEDKTAMLARCGALFREMHEGGIWHADLQIKNVLIHEGDPKLIDFDGAKFSGSWSKGQRMRNLLRFRRSLEKNGHDDVLFAALCQGYGEEASAWMQGVYALKGRLSSWMQS